ncbi:MAG TPA: GNAT family N-acetyltransferase [Acidimicrobiales bacterium]|nr:GNAT family N-acetyltransferase [Acidimicrobiales bacterium]
MTLTRRAVIDSDLDAARTAHHAAYRDVVEAQFGSWDEAVQDEFFANDWSGATFEVLAWDSTFCGYVAVESRPDDVHVRELVIHPDFQGRGIGTAVLTDAMGVARERSVPVHLATFRLNRASDLYRRLGFVEIDRDETHVTFRWTP